VRGGAHAHRLPDDGEARAAQCVRDAEDVPGMADPPVRAGSGHLTLTAAVQIERDDGASLAAEALRQEISSPGLRRTCEHFLDARRVEVARLGWRLEGEACDECPVPRQPQGKPRSLEAVCPVTRTRRPASEARNGTDISRLFCVQDTPSATGFDKEREMAGSADTCRACHGVLGDALLDLGLQPVLDEPVRPDLAGRVPLVPLVVRICRFCTLAQIDPPTARHGSTSGDAGVAAMIANARHGHARRRPGAMADHLAAWSADLLARTGVPAGALVVDVGSGDGGLLEPFQAAGMVVLGHEPRQDLAEAANAAGIRTITGAFGSPGSSALAAEAGGAHLVLVNHALAHVDDLDSMVAAMRRSLAPTGWIGIEFHDLTGLVAGGQFDVMSHAHRNYLSLTALERLLGRHGLAVVAARRSTVHGGSIQALARAAGPSPVRRVGVDRLLARDLAARLDDPQTFVRLGERARRAGTRLRQHLEAAAAAGTMVAGYGAPGRAVTLLTVANIGPALLPFTVDRDPEKHGLSLPGSAIEIRDVAAIDAQRPGEVLILAWTWAAEIRADLARIGTWGGRFVVPLPRLRTSPVGARENA
jgi:SAM-dependent methyltransferase